MTSSDQTFTEQVQRISHELNNAVTTLLGNLDLAEMALPHPPTAFVEARAAADQLTGLLRQLQDALPITGESALGD